MLNKKVKMGRRFIKSGYFSKINLGIFILTFVTIGLYLFYNSNASGVPMVVGLNGAGWGLAGDQDIKSIVNYHRLDATTDSEAASLGYNIGLLADLDYSGPYNSGGVSAIDASSWVASTLRDYESECGTGPTAATLCPSVEILNEPGGYWFWGPNAGSQTNANAYDVLLQDAYSAFHNQYGNSGPKILGSYDGSGNLTWGQELYAGNPNIGNYVDGWTMHPYGSCDATLNTGHRDRVIQAHANTGKPIYITEVGWSTDVGASCSQVSQQQQADNIFNFINWARSTGYVVAVYIFGYADYGSSSPTDDWGVAGWPNPESTHKPSWDALRCAALNLSENCTSTPKMGDINSDNSVNITDLSLMLSSYGANQSVCATNSSYICDLNNDNSVNIVDLSILLSHYGG